MYKRPHSVTILRNLWRVFYFTIIPLVRGFILALQGDLLDWAKGAWLDILVFLFMLTVAIIRWRCVKYRLEHDCITVHSGVFVKKTSRIPWDKIVTISIVNSFYLRPFNAVYLRADTLGNSFNKADFIIYLTKANAGEIVLAHRNLLGGMNKQFYIPKTSSVLTLALLGSNSTAGVLFIAAFISQSGKLLGDSFSQLMLTTLEDVLRTLAFGIPPAAIAIAIAIITAWLAGFTLIFIRYKNYLLTIQGKSLGLGGGAFTHREYSTRYSDINLIDIRQSITTKIFKLYSLYISVVGYGKTKDDIACVILTEQQAGFVANRQMLFPHLTPLTPQIKPSFTGIMRYITMPLVFCLGVPLAILLCLYMFPLWRAFILFVGAMSMLPSLLFMAVRLVEFATGGFAYDDDNYTLCYSSGFILHNVVIPKSRVVQIELMQTFWQKFGKNCDLIVSTVAETRSFHRCRNLNKKKLQEIFGVL